jgi:hypothetical protein
MAKGRGVSRDLIPNYKATLNVGYIIIPSNSQGENRDDFITNCFRRERVSVMLENGGMIQHDCNIVTHVLRDIVFPEASVSEKVEDKSRLGSLVVVLNEPYRDQSFVLGIVSKLDETNLFTEQEFRVVKGKNGNYAVLSIDGKTGSISIMTYGAEAGGDLNINVTNQSGTAALNLGVKGNININVSGDANVYTKGNINLTPAILNIGDPTKKEAILKGDKTITELNKCKARINGIINAIKTGTITPGDGGAAYKASMTASLNTLTNVENYSNIKSEKTFSE